MNQLRVIHETGMVTSKQTQTASQRSIELKEEKGVVFKRGGIQNMFIISIILLAKRPCQSHKQRLPRRRRHSQDQDSP